MHFLQLMVHIMQKNSSYLILFKKNINHFKPKSHLAFLLLLMVVKGISGYVMAILLRLRMIKMKLFKEQ